MKIKFGTDGWRAIIAKEFTNENVARITIGVALWLKQTKAKPKVVIGFDCRFGGEQFMEMVSKVLLNHKIDVINYYKPITTPAISLATKDLKCDLGIIITASHNPANYNGYKLKGSYGGPLLTNDLEQIEALIPSKADDGFEDYDLQNAKQVDLKQHYVTHVKDAFDIEAIEKSNLEIAYDGMYGSGQFIVKDLLPNVDFFRCEWNPSFYNINPEPILKNLIPFQYHLKAKKRLNFGWVNDGDADRIGLFDEKGNYLDSHTIMLLMLHYLCNYKGLKGKVATGFSSTVKIAQFCNLHNLELTIVPIGFKHICALMLNENILLGGEESGGIAVGGHIPERDGVWNGLLLIQAILETKKTISELLEEVTNLVGKFAFKRIDLNLKLDQKDSIVENCKNNSYTSFGNWKVIKTETLDGWKYYFNADEWLMIRPSGTEPVLRTYAEARTIERANQLLESCHATILKP